MFQDYDKHGLLEKITIKFGDNVNLCVFAKLLIYFDQRYKRLFVEDKLYLKHFKTIEIEFDAIESVSDGKLQKYTKMTHDPHTHNEMIFAQNSNQKYPIDYKTVEINNIQQGINNLVLSIKMFSNCYKEYKQNQINVLQLQ